MNVSFGLRQLFYYLLPGFLNLLLISLALAFGRGKPVSDTLSDALRLIGPESKTIWLVAILSLSVICGILSSVGLALLHLFQYKAGWYRSEDPRVAALIDLPSPLLGILRDGKWRSDWYWRHRKVYYYIWGILKLKLDKSMELAFDPNYTMHFGARVFLGCILGLFLNPLARGWFTEGRWDLSAFAVQEDLFLALAYVSWKLYVHYERRWCEFSVHLFTAFFQLELGAERKEEVAGHIKWLCNPPKPADPIIRPLPPRAGRRKAPWAP